VEPKSPDHRLWTFKLRKGGWNSTTASRFTGDERGSPLARAPGAKPRRPWARRWMDLRRPHGFARAPILFRHLPARKPAASRLEALGKPPPNVPFIMPKGAWADTESPSSRSRTTPAPAPMSSRRMNSNRRQGDIYVKFAKYIPRKESAPLGLDRRQKEKRVRPTRVEWNLALRDAQGPRRVNAAAEGRSGHHRGARLRFLRSREERHDHPACRSTRRWNFQYMARLQNQPEQALSTNPEGAPGRCWQRSRRQPFLQGRRVGPFKGALQHCAVDVHLRQRPTAAPTAARSSSKSQYEGRRRRLAEGLGLTTARRSCS